MTYASVVESLSKADARMDGICRASEVSSNLIDFLQFPWTWKLRMPTRSVIHLEHGLSFPVYNENFLCIWNGKRGIPRV